MNVNNKGEGQPGNILGNPGVIRSVPTAFMKNASGTEWITHGYRGSDGHHECSGYRMDQAWVTEDGL